MVERRLYVSQSELRTFARCQVRWRYSYRLHLRRRLERAPALQVGRAVHDGIDAVHRALASGLDARHAAMAGEGAVRVHCDRARETARLFASEDELASFVADEEKAVETLRLYVKHVIERDSERGFRVLLSEQPFEVPLPAPSGSRRGGVRLRGQLDGIVFDESTGAIVVRDTKTTRGDASSYDANFAKNLQLPLYILALRELGFDATGEAQLAVVRQGGPMRPRVLKSGLVSAAAVDTTRDLYELALSEQSAPPTEKQLKRLEQLPRSMSRWVSVHEHRFGESEIALALRQAYSATRQIRAIDGGRVEPIRNAAACSIMRCPFDEPCSLSHDPTMESDAIEDEFEIEPRTYSGEIWTVENGLARKFARERGIKMREK